AQALRHLAKKLSQNNDKKDADNDKVWA
ncbi:hypothetical protein MGSAQ_003193, partial [marine sediment metagenome]